MLRFRSLRIQLGGIFAGFLLLVAGSVAATFTATRAQAHDAVLINLAGRQRMLLEKITWLALAYPENPELVASIQLFEQTLHALREGGATVYGVGAADLNSSIPGVTLPPAPTPLLRQQLDQTLQSWESFRTHLDPLDAAALNAASPALLAQIDAVVSLYQVRAEAKLVRQPVQREPALRVIRSGETVISETACTNCGFLRAHIPGQCTIAPLRAGGTTLGSLCVVRDEHETFGDEETRALTLLANSAAIAITNARLIEAGRRQAEMTAALDERERLAAELHDNLAQTLSFLNLKIEHIGRMLLTGRTAEAEAELAPVKTAVAEAYGQVREALVGLREPEPVPGDLLLKLKTCLDEFQGSTGLPAELIVDSPSALALPRLVQAQILHILKEALINIQRHANAHRVWVRFERMGDHASLSIQDDGCGFDLQVPRASHHR